MADIVDQATRSRMMSGIRGKDTKPELLVRKALYARGFRFRLHVAGLPGTPDLVFPKYQAVILVQGCYWHGHDCHLFRMPSTRTEFWKAKIERNRERDMEVLEALRQKRWRVLQIWECALKGKERIGIETVAERAEGWLGGDRKAGEIRGRNPER